MHHGKFSGQFLITYQQEPDDLASLTSDPRLTATVELSEISEFIKFQVDLNDIPILNGAKQPQDGDNFEALSSDMAGKDVVINWEFLDDFNTNSELWFDANGLKMIHKKFWHRDEFNQSQTENIASNFFPIQSAIAVRDKHSDK